MRPHCTPLSLAGVLALATLAAPAATQSKHWAYQKPVRPNVPATADGTATPNPIDAFVRARLARHDLDPAPRERPARLLRRLHLDLIGLPPSPADVIAFERDPSDAAWRRIVDELLRSPRFGERWARQWLDLARYADSNGFQADQLRDSWPFRDWVINALNADMPFDQFTIEQIAGDLLPGATLQQKIATGFHRTVTCNVEAGVHPEANRINQVVDRVNTTATVWLGTTMECAQCHDHKYDPFSQRDYYRLFAFFNNTPIEVENPLGDKGVRYDFCGPWLELPLTEEQQRELRQLRAERKRIADERAAARARAEESQPRWERKLQAQLAEAPDWQVLPVTSFTSTGDEDHRILADGSVLIGGRLPDTTTYTVRVDTDLQDITAFRIEALTHASLPGSGPGRGDVKRPNFILSEFEVTVGRDGEPARTVELHSAHSGYSQKGWPVTAAIDGRRDKGWAIGGRFGKNHAATFATRGPVGGANGSVLTFTLDQRYGRGRTIGRFRLSAYCGDAELLTIPKGIATILAGTERTSAQRQRLRAYYVDNRPTVARLTRQLAAIDKRIARIEPDKTLVMVELDQPRETRVMTRGDYLRPADAVAAGTPATLHPFEEEWSHDRLGLARWLVSPDNPLVARVAVNRWWSQLFGQGLVTTEEDFGLRAPRPSHPQLLDWLAVEFVASGWSMKHMLRLIVTSQTYQQSSRRQPDATRDQDNRLLARGPRFRLGAEAIRDNALSIAGLLTLDMGGPPVFPPQPGGLWRQTGRNEPKYVVATDANRFRRGIYVIWRRAAPYPSFVMFDGPDRSSCHPTRSRTNTPMQALTLMNDEAYVEAALGFALRLVRAAGDDDDAIERAFRLAVARLPTAAERAHLLQVLTRERQRLTAEPTAVAALLDGIQSIAAGADVDRTELAAWFHIATILLNLDEVITKG